MFLLLIGKECVRGILLLSDNGFSFSNKLEAFLRFIFFGFKWMLQFDWFSTKIELYDDL